MSDRLNISMVFGNVKYPWLQKGATGHNSLEGLQGGDGDDEFYHLTANELDELNELKANQPKADEAVLTGGDNSISFTEAFSAGTEYVLWVYTYDDSGYQVGNSVSSETVSGFTVTVPKVCNLKYTATVKN